MLALTALSMLCLSIFLSWSRRYIRREERSGRKPRKLKAWGALDRTVTGSSGGSGSPGQNKRGSFMLKAAIAQAREDQTAEENMQACAQGTSSLSC